MQKAIRNQSGKPVSVESLDKRLDARERASSNPVIKVAPIAKDSMAKASKAGESLDRSREANRLAQARAEQHQVSDNAQDTKEFNVRSEG